METSNLQTFLTVTATGSFTKAAEQSFLSAPAVMKQINKLEQELGVAPFYPDQHWGHPDPGRRTL